MCVVEIDPEIDFDSRRAVYFRQMRYGLYVSSLPFVFLDQLSDCALPLALLPDSHGATRHRTWINRDEEMQ